MAAQNPFLTVLVPAFNEEASLARSVELILAKLSDFGVSAELLIVDDASKDRTGAVADELAARHGAVRVVHHAANQGIGGGMCTGITEARGEWLILIPADLALDLDELHRYFDAARDADVVVGIRSDRSDYSGFRLAVSWINIHLVRLLFGMTQRQFNYISMYRVEVLRRVRPEYWHSAFFHAEILIKAKRLGYRLVEAEVRYVPRASGRATGARPKLIVRTTRDMLQFWWRGITGTSRMPS